MSLSSSEEIKAFRFSVTLVTERGIVWRRNMDTMRNGYQRR